ncbi:AGC/YANK protein kinase [Allomyces macrogynus ATCC 38327]|uniref:AGC/YANK protein kinase n=1 Tax=Allomyces macrogynus (strain ATCC 38327) TaxID=578462 RepID=A0A0L0TAM3_ALLM3|nr:AGC/YANK protein kinase [Allomyces macrogynus ATCC 38327]|eukprot:KNE71863.1 AGC/YANK protein kinase [Allomyces macrogynus ATCC 38327]
MGNQMSEPVDLNGPVELRHFQLGRVIGKGAFGKVRVVERKKDGHKKVYALKYINKEHVIKQRAYRNIIRERSLLEKVFHPFIVNLCYAFQDDEYLFMVFDLMMGGDLRFHLTKLTHFPEPMVAFYAAEVSSALIYLQSRNVIHRDIKPDNLLLDERGHVHITDFNCACYLEDGKAIVSETGTQGYMAPEVFTNTGYRESVDWWSLGVTLYELLHGERPFNASTVDELIRLVSYEPIEWNCECSPEMLNFVLSLLDRTVSRRLGCGPRGVLDVRHHDLFMHYGYDWDKLVNKEIQPPFVPDSAAINFDARYELEELLLEEETLRPKSRKRTSGVATDSNMINGVYVDPSHPMARELRILADEFHSFDYQIYERYTGITDPTKQSVGDPPSWVRCVDPPKPLSPSTAPTSPSLDSVRPLDNPELFKLKPKTATVAASCPVLASDSIPPPVPAPPLPRRPVVSSITTATTAAATTGTRAGSPVREVVSGLFHQRGSLNRSGPEYTHVGPDGPGRSSSPVARGLLPPPPAHHRDTRTIQPIQVDFEPSIVPRASMSPPPLQQHPQHQSGSGSAGSALSGSGGSGSPRVSPSRSGALATGPVG